MGLGGYVEASVNDIVARWTVRWARETLRRTINGRRDTTSTHMPRHRCLLEVAHTCQNDDPWADASLYAFLCDGVQIGFIPAPVWEVLREHGAAQDWPLVLLPAQRAVTFADACSSVEQRTRAMNEVATWMRDHRLFPDPLDGT